MTPYTVSPSRCFNHPWRSGHPFRPRCGRMRRAAMVVLLLLFSLIIGGYNYLTNSRRVRTMAESYLSDMIGGRVEVKSATLSIFEGLRLDDVKVYVDREGDREPDSLIFSAQAFVLKYDPRTLLAGQIDANQIIAQKPHVYLTEDLDHPGEWNFHRLGRGRIARKRRVTSDSDTPRAIPLPEVLLRNAQVVISEVRDGESVRVGFMAIDGQLTPTGMSNRYTFTMQARGVEGVGPYARGDVALNTQELHAELHNFDFSRDLRSMLPADVRDWWARHALGGGIDTLKLSYLPAHRGQKQAFQVEMDLRGVTISVPPEDLMGREEIAKLHAAEGTGFRVQGEKGSGFGVQGSGELADDTQRDTGVPPVQGASGLNKPGPTEPPSRQHGRDARVTLDGQSHVGSASADAEPLDRATGPSAKADPTQGPTQPPRAFTQSSVLSPQSSSTPAPIRLQDGHGHFVFTEHGIQLHDVTGLVENNSFTINGHIDGYDPAAPAQLVIRSSQGTRVFIPPNPGWANSLPAFVRNIYQDIRPTGYCQLELHLDRPTPGTAPVVSGTVDITGGQFCYRQFAYPVRDASGTIAFGPDPSRGPGDFVRIINFRGRGIPGGPNENMSILANGVIGPLGPEDPEVRVVVQGQGISSEPALVAAYPHEIRDALAIFDADKKGVFPQYRGNFQLTLVHHAHAKKWTFDTDVDLLDASGKLVGFRYPMHHVHGKLQVRDGYVNILDVGMEHDGIAMKVAGRVDWEEGPDRGFKLLGVHQWKSQPIARFAHDAFAEPNTKIDLNVSVHGLPINSDLVNAIPPEHAVWLKRLGLGGTLDVQGRVYQGIRFDSTLNGPANLSFARLEPRRLDQDPDDVNFDLAIGLHDGTFWPADGMFSVSQVAGNLHLTRDGIVIESLRGTRDRSTLTADGTVAWADGKPDIAIHATGQNLLLDSALYAMLPPDARGSWDEVQPKGRLDAELYWRGAADRLDAPPSDARVAGGPAGASSPPAPNAHNRDALAAYGASIPESDTSGEGREVSVLAGNRIPPPQPSPGVPGAGEEALALPSGADASSRIGVPGFYAILQPRGMSCTIRSMPYRMDGLTGTIVIDHDHVRLKDIHAHHGPAQISVEGSGSLGGPRPLWDLSVNATSVAVNDEFRAAAPDALRSLIDSIKLRGVLDFSFPRLQYVGESSGKEGSGFRVQGSLSASRAHVGSTLADAEPLDRAIGTSAKTEPTQGPTQPSRAFTQSSVLSPQSSSLPDLDLSAIVTLHDGSLDAGVPLDHVEGRIRMATAVRNGKLSKLDGSIDVEQLRMASRTVNDFHASLKKPEDSDELNLDNMRANVAGGQMAGQLHMVIPDVGQSRYTLGLVVRNADVKTLAGDADKNIRGQLTASVSLEGTWGQTSMRRGRGDVTVSGKELYRMPLILGLIQVTNLSLPISGPFNQGLARYSVDGQRVTFERIDLKSDNMMMTGSGHLDFGKKEVRMTFTTDTPGGFKIPFINDIWQGARQELFKINIKGSIQQPRVEAVPFGTVTTTIDEVLKGDAKN